MTRKHLHSSPVVFFFLFHSTAQHSQSTDLATVPFTQSVPDCETPLACITNHRYGTLTDNKTDRSRPGGNRSSGQRSQVPGTLLAISAHPSRLAPILSRFSLQHLDLKRAPCSESHPADRYLRHSPRSRDASLCQTPQRRQDTLPDSEVATRRSHLGTTKVLLRESTPGGGGGNQLC